MTVHRDFAIVIGAAMALAVGFGSLQFLDKPAPKGNRITASPPASVAPVATPAPAAMEPAPPKQPAPIVDPVAAGPALVEAVPPITLQGPATGKTTLTSAKPKRKVRVRVPRKPDPCVGPLCVLVTARR